MVAGALYGLGPFYDATGCCGGGDDPSLTSGLVGATVGAYVTRTSDHPVSLSRALAGATVGIGTGLFVGAAGAQLADLRGFVIGFSLGQGGTVAGFALPYP